MKYRVIIIPDKELDYYHEYYNRIDSWYVTTPEQEHCKMLLKQILEEFLTFPTL